MFTSVLRSILEKCSKWERCAVMAILQKSIKDYTSGIFILPHVCTNANPLQMFTE